MGKKCSEILLNQGVEEHELTLHFTPETGKNNLITGNSITFVDFYLSAGFVNFFQSLITKSYVKL